MKIIIINGPNLNLLGKRQKSIYGNISFEEYLKKLRKSSKIIKSIIFKVMLKVF